MSRGRAALVAVGALVLGAVAVASIVGSRASERVTDPLDPASVGDDGLRAFVLLAEDNGVSVRATTALPLSTDGATVLVVDDQLSAGQRRSLLAWIDAGGALVVTDPSSSLHPGGDRDAGAGPAFGRWPRGTCTIDALAGIDGLDALALDDSLAYVLGPDDRGCFGDERRAFVLERAEGAGRVTALGGPSPLVNHRLAEEGNAALALRLVQRDGRDELVVLRPEVLAGERMLVDLVPRRIWIALAQLGVAFVVVAWWRARRLGVPPSEPDAVVIPGAELVVAAGALAARHGHAARTAEVLRADARRDLAARVGLPADTPIDVLDRVVSARAGAAPGTVGALLDGREPESADALVDLAPRLDRLRQEVP